MFRKERCICVCALFLPLILRAKKALYFKFILSSVKENVKIKYNFRCLNTMNVTKIVSLVTISPIDGVR